MPADGRAAITRCFAAIAEHSMRHADGHAPGAPPGGRMPILHITPRRAGLAFFRLAGVDKARRAEAGGMLPDCVSLDA